jgi:hypothetical protein
MPTVDELVTELTHPKRTGDAAESVLSIQSLKARYGALVDPRFVKGRLALTAVVMAPVGEGWARILV